MRPCYIFDMDGTLTVVGDRLRHIQKDPKDWKEFFRECGGDLPNYPVVDLARTLLRTLPVIFVSGRPEECRMATEDWLNKIGFPLGPLYMRKDGDHRDDDIIKGELLDVVIKDGWKPIMAFDDRSRVVKMWRSRGIPCCQVAEGDF